MRTVILTAALALAACDAMERPPRSPPSSQLHLKACRELCGEGNVASFSEGAWSDFVCTCAGAAPDAGARTTGVSP